MMLATAEEVGEEGRGEGRLVCDAVCSDDEGCAAAEAAADLAGELWPF